MISLVVARNPDGVGSEVDRGPRRAWLHLVAGLTGLGLLACGLPSPAAAIALLLGHAPVSTGGAEAVSEVAILTAASFAVWSILLWGLLAAVAAGIGSLPGRVGHAGRTVLRRVAPGMAKKMVVVAVGATVAANVAACGAGAAAVHGDEPVAGAAHLRVGSSAGSSTGVLLLGVEAVDRIAVEGSAKPVMPDSGQEPPPIAPAAVRQVVIDWPATGGTQPPVAKAGVSSADTTGSTGTGGGGGGAGTGGTRAGGSGVNLDWPGDEHTTKQVVVLRGDSLWEIAARALPAGTSDADIDLAWRAWYAANRSVIGPDPNLILPGQILRSPNQGTGTQR